MYNKNNITNSNNKDTYKSFKLIAYFTQFSISTVAPIILLTLLGNWLTKTLKWPLWVMVIFILIGLAGTVVSFIKGIKIMVKLSEDKKKYTDNIKAKDGTINSSSQEDLSQREHLYNQLDELSKKINEDNTQEK